MYVNPGLNMYMHEPSHARPLAVLSRTSFICIWGKKVTRKTIKNVSAIMRRAVWCYIRCWWRRGKRRGICGCVHWWSACSDVCIVRQDVCVADEKGVYSGLGFWCAYLLCVYFYACALRYSAVCTCVHASVWRVTFLRGGRVCIFWPW